MRSDQIIPLIQPNSVHDIDMSINANVVMASFTLVATFRTSKQLIFGAAVAAQPAGAAAAADDALPTADGNVGGVTRSEATAEEQRQRRRRWN